MSDAAELRPFIEDAARHLDAAIAEATPQVPDVLAIVELARELDPDRVTEQFVAQVGQLAPVFPLGPAREGDSSLAPFSDAARELLEERTAAPAPAPVKKGWRRVRAMWAVAGVAAAAAALVALALQVGPTQLQGNSAPNPNLATQVLPEVVDNVDGAIASSRESSSAGARTVSPPRDEVTVVPEEPAKPAVSDHGKPRPSLSELDAKAQKAWAAGDVKEAERLFRLIIRRGGRSRYVELAYGDLFAIARQRRNRTQQVKLWKAYLGRFPRGRFAEDTRAELCRRSRADKARACWADYLEHHPGGSHAAEARRQGSE